MMDPLLKKQLSRFRRNRRAFVSFCILTVLFVLSLFSEWLCNDKPFVMRYEQAWYFPMFKYYPASLFGDTVRTEPDYKAIADARDFRTSGNWAIFPIVRYGPNESVQGTEPPPTPPS